MNKINRRSFIKGSTAVASSFVLPRFSIGKSGPSANSKLNIAIIGCSGTARGAFRLCNQSENMVAMVDVDSRRFGKFEKDFPYAKQVRKFEDYRIMLDKMEKEIDAVYVQTPDHTHFNATLDSMERRKHVFTQKPLTHNIWQARTLQKAKQKYGVITNMGNQGHTSNGIRQMREMYEADLFGQVKEVHLGFQGPEWDGLCFMKPQPQSTQIKPKELNWDLWLGPNAERPYNRHYHPGTWRGFYEFGTGEFGDWFCHIGDGPVWILDLYKPTVIECIERGPAIDGMLPEYSVVRFDFPARGKKEACSIYWYDGSLNGGTAIKSPDDWGWGQKPISGSFWFGEKENAYLDRRSSNPLFASKERMRAFKENGGTPRKYARVNCGPHEEFIKAIKNEIPEAGSNFDYAAPLTEIALLGVIAQRFGGRVEWDSDNMCITNRPELNEYIKEPVRPEWKKGESLWT